MRKIPVTAGQSPPRLYRANSRARAGPPATTPGRRGDFWVVGSGAGVSAGAVVTGWAEVIGRTDVTGVGWWSRIVKIPEPVTS